GVAEACRAARSRPHCGTIETSNEFQTKTKLDDPGPRNHWSPKLLCRCAWHYAIAEGREGAGILSLGDHARILALAESRNARDGGDDHRRLGGAALRPYADHRRAARTIAGPAQQDVEARLNATHAAVALNERIELFSLPMEFILRLALAAGDKAHD